MTREYGMGRTQRLSFTASPAEADRLRFWAAAHGMGLGEYVRFRALQAPVEREGA